MRLTVEQRNAILNALPTSYGSVGSEEEILVFEDDGGGWHHDPTVETWASWSLIADGTRYLYNIRSCLSETWNSDTLKIDDERGQLERGTVNIYVCSTDKSKVQAYSSELAALIDRTRLGLSLDDYQGLTTGPEEAKTRQLSSYNDLRLKKRVYRTVLEVPILYKFTVIESPPLIKKIEVEPWMGWPLAEMGTLTLRAPMLLTANMALAEDVQNSLASDTVLLADNQSTLAATMLLD